MYSINIDPRKGKGIGIHETFLEEVESSANRDFITRFTVLSGVTVSHTAHFCMMPKVSKSSFHKFYNMFYGNLRKTFQSDMV